MPRSHLNRSDCACLYDPSASSEHAYSYEGTPSQVKVKPRSPGSAPRLSSAPSKKSIPPAEIIEPYMEHVSMEHGVRLDQLYLP